MKLCQQIGIIMRNFYFIQTSVVDVPDDTEDKTQTLMMGFLHKLLGTGKI